MPKRERVTEGVATRSDPLRPYVPQHQTYYDFAMFARIGEAFVIGVAKTFAVRAGGISKEGVRRDYSILRGLLNWIEANKSFPVFRTKLLNNYQSILVDEWEAVLNTWRDDLVNGDHPQAETSRALTIRSVNVLIEALVTSRVIRPIARLVPIKNANKKGAPKKCLAEVAFPQSTEQTHEQESEVTRSGRFDHHIEAIGQLNDRRLHELRSCAERELRKWSEHFNEGERLLGLCDMHFSEIRNVLHYQKNRGFRTWALRRLFPSDQPDIALSRYLTYVVHELGGVIPTEKQSKHRNFHYHFCKSRGGIAKVRAYLVPHVEASNAARIMFLIDTGANAGVCYTLNRDCISESDVPGHKAIAGFKDRARGKLIVSELPVKDARYEISCVQALTIYREMSKRLETNVRNSQSERLFVHLYETGEIKPITFSVAGNQFKAFLERNEELRGLPLRSDMIRTTVLFQAMYKNDGNLVAANALGDHAAFSTTSIYANRPSLRLVYQRLIREFQSLFQAVCISDVDGAGVKLRMSDTQLQGLLRQAHRTGLGVACLNPKGGYQPGSKKGEDCVALEKCPRCPLRFVIATVSNVTDLILFDWHLRLCRREFEATRSQRWVETWLPWLVFAEVALEKIQRGPTAAVYLRAKKDAAALIASGEMTFPPLW